ncbi:MULTISPECIES: alpha-L-arabinofuranosidase C-terminal domain-containing protein [Acidobacteriaceae]|uniref:alpha-L-arabinofuranosidase C-terminal domain-containing protein n=1 Tax=Acidobacteriaceae TaxID=204434 RepID=UPI00131C8A1B|nr:MULTISPECIES: alpha-L-arabinofuranosidase C-terminal domain-containing protein [Acidobacteriaceae]MDW5264596.1 alpha-L-arabinofuranosidase C-terminal domain-containing protein [Edaphobacter sp.]
MSRISAFTKSFLQVASVTALTWMATYPLSAQITNNAAVTDTPIEVHILRTEAPEAIPTSVFGSFLEPIGKSTYGGLWADALENPSFEDGLWSAGNIAGMLHARPELRRASQLGIPLPWEPLDQAQGNRYQPVWGDAANSTRSLLVMSLPGKEVGIRQMVYLPVHRELTYTGSIWLKHIEGPADVTVSLRTHDQKDSILVAQSLNAAATAWTKFTFTLVLKPGQVAPLAPVDFVLALKNDARVEVDQASLMPADNIDGMDPDVIAMARDLHSPLIRFGGNFTSAYDWKDGIGPRDKRVGKLNVSWGIPEYNTFGTDEFLEFCKLINAQPQIALNLGTGTPQDAAAWVKYVDQHWGDHKGGLLWELGNELWGDFQVGYPSLERVAQKTLATSQAVRKVDPTSRLIATGADEDHFHDWNAAQLSNPVGTFDLLSTHFVVNDSVQMPDSTAQFRAMASLALPIGLEERMHAIHAQIQQSPHRDHVNTAFTEWLMISDSHTGLHFTNMGGALFAGGFLNMIIRNSKIVPISDMTGIMEFGGIWSKRGQVYGAPAYWVLREYANAEPRTLLRVQSNSPVYSVAHGVNRLPDISDVPYLDVDAAESAGGRSLVLFCVNRDLTQALTANFDFASLGVKGRVAKVTTIAADNILAENNEENPNKVKPLVDTEEVHGAFTHKFPSASVTIIEISLQ